MVILKSWLLFFLFGCCSVGFAKTTRLKDIQSILKAMKNSPEFKTDIYNRLENEHHAVYNFLSKFSSKKTVIESLEDQEALKDFSVQTDEKESESANNRSRSTHYSFIIEPKPVKDTCQMTSYFNKEEYAAFHQKREAGEKFSIEIKDIRQIKPSANIEHVFLVKRKIESKVSFYKGKDTNYRTADGGVGSWGEFTDTKGIYFEETENFEYYTSDSSGNADSLSKKTLAQIGEHFKRYQYGKHQWLRGMSERAIEKSKQSNLATYARTHKQIDRQAEIRQQLFDKIAREISPAGQEKWRTIRGLEKQLTRIYDLSPRIIEVEHPSYTAIKNQIERQPREAGDFKAQAALGWVYFASCKYSPGKFYWNATGHGYSEGGRCLTDLTVDGRNVLLNLETRDDFKMPDPAEPFFKFDPLYSSGFDYSQWEVLQSLQALCKSYTPAELKLFRQLEATYPEAEINLQIADKVTDNILPDQFFHQLQKVQQALENNYTEGNPDFLRALTRKAP